MREQQFNIWTGTGCHGKGSEIKMYGQSIKKVEDIVLGDKVLGDDGRSRRVIRTFCGHDHLYTVKVFDVDETSFKLSPNHRSAIGKYWI